MKTLIMLLIMIALSFSMSVGQDINFWRWDAFSAWKNRANNLSDSVQYWEDSVNALNALNKRLAESEAENRELHRVANWFDREYDVLSDSVERIMATDNNLDQLLIVHNTKRFDDSMLYIIETGYYSYNHTSDCDSIQSKFVHSSWCSDGNYWANCIHHYCLDSIIAETTKYNIYTTHYAPTEEGE